MLSSRAINSRRPLPSVLNNGGLRISVFRHPSHAFQNRKEIGILLPNNHRQHCTLQIQENVLPEQHVLQM
jgi:hypothetical protein